MDKVNRLDMIQYANFLSKVGHSVIEVKHPAARAEFLRALEDFSKDPRVRMPEYLRKRLVADVKVFVEKHDCSNPVSGLPEDVTEVVLGQPEFADLRTQGQTVH